MLGRSRQLCSEELYCGLHSKALLLDPLLIRDPTDVDPQAISIAGFSHCSTGSAEPSQPP
ncbi:MAG: hypothetical protein DMG82_14400 [Acidobacteria bacterium]|nr:MAG: hypothetical protein DMG82_14400 [Acidobacteriota bacterium]PYX42036.1 MAG: hypothetical protein DMG83_22185 [Acidobacteriota bacterium]